MIKNFHLNIFNKCYTVIIFYLMAGQTNKYTLKETLKGRIWTHLTSELKCSYI